MNRRWSVARSITTLVVVPLLTLTLIGPSAVALAAPDPGFTTAAAALDPAIQAALTTLGDDAFSLVDLTTALPDPPATQHYGPYASGSPDSGTCGNNWAEDTFNRDFTVRATGPGTYTVVEQFKDGSFVTMAGPSPGSCETDKGGQLMAGNTGTMHGYFIVTNVMAQTSMSPYCDAVNSTNADCTTATFINSHFTPCYPATCTVTTYFDHYTSPHLAVTEWKNASCDRGGDQGDIATTAGIAAPNSCP